MKNYQIWILCIIAIQGMYSIANSQNPHIGDICHVEAEYYYPGVWEQYGKNELICNYWKFLEETERQLLESQLSEDEENNESD